MRTFASLNNDSMNLKEIMAIAGKPGLYKMIAQAKNGIIVESLIDQKRIQAFSHDKVSTLGEISVYTEAGDTPLSDIIRTMYSKLDGNPAPDFKGDNNKIKQFFEELLPDYDKERVYVSHMQKIIGWYNLLLEKGLIDMEEEAEEGSVGEDTAEPETTAEADASPDKGKETE